MEHTATHPEHYRHAVRVGKEVVYKIVISFYECAAELQARLEEFVASGSVEVRENGGRVAPFSDMSWEVRAVGEKPLLHLWSERFNLTRRVLAIIGHSEERLALAVERFGRAKPDRLSSHVQDALRSSN